MYNMMTIVNSSVLYIWELLKEKTLNVLVQEKKITLWGDG